MLRKVIDMKFFPKDPGSAITHFIGWLMALLAAFPLILKAASAPDPVHIISLTIFIVSMIALYGASTIYHSLDINEKVNQRLKKLDHMMIFVLIAGTYTPVCVIAIRGTLGFGMLALIWGIAVLGIILKPSGSIAPNGYPPFFISVWDGPVCWLLQRYFIPCPGALFCGFWPEELFIQWVVSSTP